MTLLLSILASVAVVGGTAWIVATIIHLMAAYTDGRVDCGWYPYVTPKHEDTHTGIYAKAYERGWMRTIRKEFEREEERERSRREAEVRKRREASQR